MKRRPHIPRWKYWLSYLSEVHLTSTPTDINPHLYISIVKGRLQLCSQNAVYSYEDRYDNFRLLFDQIKLDEKPYRSALVLGLGLGSVPLLIEKKGLALDRMTFVELDEQVIRLAEEYTLRYLQTPYESICADAAIFALTHQGAYDFIVSDVFLDDVIPDDLLTKDYVHALHDLLNPDGLIVINTLASTDADKKHSLSYFNDVVKPIFPQATYTHVWENYMIQIPKSTAE